MHVNVRDVLLGVLTATTLHRFGVECITEAANTCNAGISEICTAPVISAEEKVSLPNFLEEKNLTAVDASMSKYSGKGGAYTPPHCQPSTKIAIIIPYRNRSTHLAHFLEIMHPFLQRQRLQYTIVVVNQTGEDPFLRGLLHNAGVLESLTHLPFRPDCFILHDVDHIPERLGLAYQCSQSTVLQFSNPVDRFEYQPLNKRLKVSRGGVTAITKGQFESINGFSNLYTDGALEDKDFSARIRRQGLIWDVLPEDLSRYSTMPDLPALVDPSVRLDMERIKKLQDGVNRINKRLADNVNLTELGAGFQEQGLNNARDYYELAGMVYHNSFTEVKIKPRFNLVRRDASQSPAVKQLQVIGLKFV